MKGHPKPANFDKLFQRTNQPILIDCYVDLSGEELEESINHTLFGPIGSDTFSLVAQCSCGALTGSDDLGRTCKKCNTQASTLWASDSSYPFKRWIKLPEGVKFFHPLLMYQLIRALPVPKMHKRYKPAGSNKVREMTTVDWILDITTPIPDYLHDIPGRGMTYVAEHFMEVMQYLIGKMRPAQVDSFREFLFRYQERWLMDKLPIIAPSLQRINFNNENTTYALVDSVSPMFREVYSGLCSIVTSQRVGSKLTRYNKDRRLYKLYKKYLEYTNELLKSKAIGKYKLIRQGAISNRWHYSGRTVSAPIVDMHYYDEIRIPWVMAVVVYKSFILNILLNRYRLSLTEAQTMWSIAKSTMPCELDDESSTEVRESVLMVQEVLDTILLEFRTKGGLKGGPCLINRNPSIRHLALQLVFAVGYSQSKSLHVSSMIFSRPNTDADGDNMSLFFIRELSMLKELSGLHPSTALVSGKFASLSDFLRCHSTTTVSLNNLLQRSLQIHGGSDVGV